MGNEPISPYRSMRQRIQEMRDLQKTAQKAQTELSASIAAQITSDGKPLTGGDPKLRAGHGENVLTTGAKNDEGLKHQLADIAPTQVMEDAAKKVGAKVTTNKACTTEKKAAWLAVAEKTASLTAMDKKAAASEREVSILSGIAKEASVYPNQAEITYKEASRVTAAIVGAKMLNLLEGIEKRAAATLEGKDNLHEELTPEMVQQILEMNAITPDGAMSPEEHAAILQNAPADEVSDAAAIVAGNTGDDAELPVPTDEELGKLEDVEKAVETAEGEEKGEGCKCGDPECKGCGMDAEEKTAALHQAYLCQYISGIRGDKVAAYRARPTAEAVAMHKIALLQRTVDGLKGVIAGQDAELEKMSALQDKVATLEKTAAKVQTVNPDTVNAMFAEAVRANLVTGSESEIQNMKVAALSSPDELVKIAGQIVRNAASRQINKLGSVRTAAVRADDVQKADDVKQSLAKLRNTINANRT